MRNIWAVARVTVREADASEGGAGPADVPRHPAAGPGPVRQGRCDLPGRVQMFLDWSLRSSRLILGFLTIFVACGTLAWELKYRQAFITLVKPIPRWQFLVGKWVGVGLLNVILLACVGLVVEGFTWHFRGRPGLAWNGGHLRWKDEAVPLTGLTEQQRKDEQRDRDILLGEVLVARVALLPVPPMAEFVDEVNKLVDQRKEEGLMPPEMSEEQFRTDLLETETPGLRHRRSRSRTASSSSTASPPPSAPAAPSRSATRSGRATPPPTR